MSESSSIFRKGAPSGYTLLRSGLSLRGQADALLGLVEPATLHQVLFTQLH